MGRALAWPHWGRQMPIAQACGCLRELQMAHQSPAQLGYLSTVSLATPGHLTSDSGQGVLGRLPEQSVAEDDRVALGLGGIDDPGRRS